MLDSLPYLKNSDFPAISRNKLEILQVNLGYLCNLSCTHCHVNASPKRTELMDKATMDEILAFIDSYAIHTLDLTGGAPEMNPHFRYFVTQAVNRGLKIIDRCNLVILLLSGFEWLASFLAKNRVEIVASLPCYLKDNVDKQRGKGTFAASIIALQKLNALGYGLANSDLPLNLVFNPQGATLPPNQQALERDYKKHLQTHFGIVFNQLFAMTNLPIQRFGSVLLSNEQFDDYMNLLKDKFYAPNLDKLMCKNTVSVDWQGFVYDCDFNQMLKLPLGTDKPTHIHQLSDLTGKTINTLQHCYGCTAGQGSSCTGAIKEIFATLRLPVLKGLAVVKHSFGDEMAIETGVLQRYSLGAESIQADLCCPVDYDRELLALLPQEIIDKDYGCGDPSRYVQQGDVVLDLGSGSGKICYMAAQLVGDTGKVIGVDMNDDMLALARKYQVEMAEKIGSANVEFVKGQIQDLALDLAALNQHLAENPITNAEDVIHLRAWQEKQRKESPLIADNSVDLVVSNCVLNLVHDSDKEQLIQEIFRVTKAGGRVAISDIVSDEAVPRHLKADTHLWSGCISGALQEHEFLEAFVDAGFVAVAYDKWESQAWQVVEGIEFRSVTITAIKPHAEPCLDKGHAVLYRGPFSKVYDDEGHVFYRGQRMAVCERSCRLLTSTAYADHFIGIAPVQKQTPKNWCHASGTLRPAAETKGAAHQADCASGCC